MTVPVAARLKRELTHMRLRLAVTRLVVRDMSPLVGEDDECIDLVINDVMRRWQTGGLDESRASGLDEFWDRYADRVEFAPPGSDDEYRVEFFAPDPGPVDMNVYYQAAWRAHVMGLDRHG